ncbi:hypothetical protein SAMN05445850_2191 [Paraburkholderia tuberum]|uniref:Uncharacterized protein n=2 Tax=Paraburkholderia tuberum TaxID=157910 RepID=A0A1H1EYW3_9BURK|nr:hypothetical protein [Paraburkholderia tuberum]SDQ93880.1 hypothetical protein SAMN05445850_2191 [Paraburkholderia tuberum]
MGRQKQDGTVGKGECELCRITYSIYSNFPPMPSAMALNVETGEWFPFDRLKSYSNGYDMAEALGYAWACDCRGRKATPALTSKVRTGVLAVQSEAARHDEQFTLHDANGRPLASTYYTVRLLSGALHRGTTDSQGRTERYETEGAQSMHIYLGHREVA